MSHCPFSGDLGTPALVYKDSDWFSLSGTSVLVSGGLSLPKLRGVPDFAPCECTALVPNENQIECHKEASTLDLGLAKSRGSLTISKSVGKLMCLNWK